MVQKRRVRHILGGEGDLFLASMKRRRIDRKCVFEQTLGAVVISKALIMVRSELNVFENVSSICTKLRERQRL
jgi:hypothetical protein